jgi:hypothetical protein
MCDRALLTETTAGSIDLPRMKEEFTKVLVKPIAESAMGSPPMKSASRVKLAA